MPSSTTIFPSATPLCEMLHSAQRRQGPPHSQSRRHRGWHKSPWLAVKPIAYPLRLFNGVLVAVTSALRHLLHLDDPDFAFLAHGVDAEASMLSNVGTLPGLALVSPLCIVGILRQSPPSLRGYPAQSRLSSSRDAQAARRRPRVVPTTPHRTFLVSAASHASSLLEDSGNVDEATQSMS